MTAPKLLIDHYVDQCTKRLQVWIGVYGNIHISACCEAHERLALNAIREVYPDLPERIVQ